MAFLDKLKSGKTIVAIVLGSFFVSLAYSFIYQIRPVVDAKAYDAIAVNIAEGYGFREDKTKPFVFDAAITRAGPAYEFFLAGLYVAFGHRYEVVWIAQAILHAASVWLIYLICLRVFGGLSTTPNPSPPRRVSILASALVGFSPDLIEISAMLMTETLYLFCTILVVYLFVRAWQAPRSLPVAAFLGAAAGLAILTRPPILLFVPVILWMYWRRSTVAPITSSLPLPERELKGVGASFIFVFLFILALAPWTARNYRIYGHIIPTTMIGSYNLWLGNTLASNGGQFNSADNPLTAYVAEHGYAELGAKASAEFWSFALEHPADFVKLTVIRFIRYFSLIRPMGFWFYQTGVPQLVFVGLSGSYIAILFIFGFAGMLAAYRKKNEFWNYIIVMALTSPIFLFITVAQSRYRFQIYPFLAIFAAFLLSRWRENPPWKDKAVIHMAFALISISIADAILFFPVVVERIQALFSA